MHVFVAFKEALYQYSCLLLDVFQLVSVKLPKSSSQEVEATELSFVLDYINQSPKCVAFGNEVYLALLVFCFAHKIPFLVISYNGDFILPSIDIFLLVTKL